MRSALIVVSLLALVSVGAWIVLHDNHQAPSSTENLSAAAAAETSEQAHTDSEPGSFQEIERNSAALPSSAEENSGSSAHKQDATAPFVLHVVDGETQAAIPHAEVIEVRTTDDFHHQSLVHRARYSDWLEAPAELVIKHKADENGDIKLKQGENFPTIIFFAVSENLYGSTYTSIADGKEGTLKLWSDQTWTALTINSSGQPLAGIPVAIQQIRAEGGYTWFPIRTISDANGIAHLRHIQERVRNIRTGDMTKVLPKVPLHEDLSVIVDLASPPPQPIVFELPQLGSLEIEFLDAAGEAMSGSFDLHLAVDSNPIQGRSLDELQDTMNAKGTVTFRNPGNHGKAKFDYVGLGLDFFIDIYSKEHGSFYGSGKGPTRPGETAVIQVRQPEPSGFQVRFIDEHKQPIALASWTMSINLEHEDGGRGTGESGKTDANGMTFIEIEADWLDALQTATEAQGEVTAYGTNPSRLWKATIPFPVSTAANTKTLGDVVLLEQDAVDIHGTITDEQGNPIYYAFFSLQEFVSEGDSQYWSTIDVVTTDDLGRFHYFERRPHGEARYGISKQGFRTLLADGTPEDGAQFILSRGLQISGTVQISEWMQDTWTSLLYRETNSKQARWRYVRDYSRKTGTFQLQGLTASSVDFILQNTSHRVDLATMTDVHPWADGAVPDSRLAPWVINPTAQEFLFTVTDASGAIIPGAKAIFLDPDLGSHMRAGKVTPSTAIALPVSTTQAKFAAPRFRSSIVEVHAGENTIVLKAGLPVKLQLNDAPALSPGTRVACEIFTKGPHISEWSSTLSSWQDLSFLCSEAREYHVRIATVPPGKQPWEETSTVLVDQTFVVAEQENEQVIVLDVDWQ